MALDNSSFIQTGLALTPESAPPELYNEFYKIYTAVHNLERFLSEFAGVDEWPTVAWSQLSLDQTIKEGNMNRWYPKQSEALTFGMAVSPILDAGELKVRKANATTNAKFCCGFVSSSDHNSSIGSNCEIMIGAALIKGITGLITGSRYFLSTTDGVVTNAAPVAAGNIEQVVGLALASNRLLMNLNFAWVQH